MNAVKRLEILVQKFGPENWHIRIRLFEASVLIAERGTHGYSPEQVLYELSSSADELMQRLKA